MINSSNAIHPLDAIEGQAHAAALEACQHLLDGERVNRFGENIETVYARVRFELVTQAFTAARAAEVTR